MPKSAIPGWQKHADRHQVARFAFCHAASADIMSLLSAGVTKAKIVLLEYPLLLYALLISRKLNQSIMNAFLYYKSIRYL